MAGPSSSASTTASKKRTRGAASNSKKGGESNKQSSSRKKARNTESDQEDQDIDVNNNNYNKANTKILLQDRNQEEQEDDDDYDDGGDDDDEHLEVCEFVDVSLFQRIPVEIVSVIVTFLPSFPYHFSLRLLSKQIKEELDRMRQRGDPHSLDMSRMLRVEKEIQIAERFKAHKAHHTTTPMDIALSSARGQEHPLRTL
eukprot:GEZU01003315.1.p2 GENE.GEZU01003315.1~~GEZU01003315.1.p2  ORF type:complete len:199 (+),score=62.52 GEZU01003315.1:70-666(+)